MFSLGCGQRTLALWSSGGVLLGFRFPKVLDFLRVQVKYCLAGSLLLCYGSRFLWLIMVQARGRSEIAGFEPEVVLHQKPSGHMVEHTWNT